MKEVWQRIEKWLAENTPEDLIVLNGGASDEEVKNLEEHLSVTFPDDVKTFYKIHNGQSDDGPYLLDGRELLSLERIKDEWDVWKELLDGGDFEDVESEPEAGIRKDWWNEKWIPLTYDGSGNHDCLDLAPDNSGTSGQIISFWHDDPDRNIVANSFREWLENYADDLEAGLYVYSDEYGGVVRKEDIEDIDE